MVELLDLYEGMYYVAFFTSMSLNSLLLYLVRNYTDKTMGEFASVIMQTVIVDMITSAVVTFSQLHIEAANGDIFEAPGCSLNNYVFCMHSMIFGGITNINFWSIPIQAIYRYIVIVKKKQIPFWYATVLYSIITIDSIVCGMPLSLRTRFISGTPEEAKVSSLPFWKERDTSRFCLFVARDWATLLFMINMVGQQLVAFGLLIWLTSKLNQSIRAAKSHLSEKTLSVHAQMTKKLYAQACLPGFISILVTIICGLTFVLPSYNGGFFLILFAPYPWIGVANPLLTILCIQHYRKAVINMIFRGRHGNVRSFETSSSLPGMITNTNTAKSTASVAPGGNVLAAT
uniref:G_PROTEIN_RECEP_F1_2 domain-containing protein n=1 Tax=Panagrellus redivivus TaxID=6233 RepID=A0A7E4VP66_PANRE